MRNPLLVSRYSTPCPGAYPREETAPRPHIATARAPTLLPDARPVPLNVGEPGAFDITPWADRVQLIDAKYAGMWQLPVLGAVTAPSAVLIRPDGYVRAT